MSIHVNEVVYVLLVLGALILVSIGLSEIITFLATRFYSLVTRRVPSGNIIAYLQRPISKVWYIYTEYAAELVFFGFAIAFLVEKLATIPNITPATLVRTMNNIPWLWVGVLVSGVLWICAKRTMRKRAEKERTEWKGKLDDLLAEIKGLRNDLKGK